MTFVLGVVSRPRFLVLIRNRHRKRIRGYHPAPLSPRVRAFSSLALGIAIIVAIVAACSAPESTGTGHRAPGLGVYIPLAWKTDRVVSGHARHVVELHIPCTRCHALTADSMGTVSPIRCAACHAEQARFDHAEREARKKFGPAVSTDCMTCHMFTVEGAGRPAAELLASVPPPTACGRCHASKGNDAPQVEVHATSACVTCHTPHENGKPHGGPCADCHQDIKTEHASAGKTPSEVCTTCHSHQHAPASAAIGACVTCHASHEPVIPVTALFAGGHTECIGCHRPHDFTPASVVPCRSCHENQHVLAESIVPAHARCESCHAPHDVRGVSDQVCFTCHANVHSDHPKQAAGSCIGCHNPHPHEAATAVIARPCSNCHQIAASDHAFHGGIACETCHQPHQFKLTLASTVLCRNCHAKQVTLVSTNAGHQACEGCHRGLPHQPAKVEVPCATCHAAVVAVVTKGHSECTQCHEPHSGAFAAVCKTCHAVEQQTAPPGHQACTNCHDQHNGVQKAPCAACHQVEAASEHGKIAGGCTNCHRPHGPGGIFAPPACTTCHQPAQLPGLHSIPKHQLCMNCHTGHGDPTAPLRTPCLTCHTDRKDHFPDAPSCTSCHLFGPTK